MDIKRKRIGEELIQIASKQKAKEILPTEVVGPLFQKFNKNDCSEIISEYWMKSSRWMQAVCAQSNIIYIHILQPYAVFKKVLARIFHECCKIDLNSSKNHLVA